MTATEILLPKPKTYHPSAGGVTCCHTRKLNWIESTPELKRFIEPINVAFTGVAQPPLPWQEKINLGCRMRIVLQTADRLKPEAYTLNIGHESVTITGGDEAGLFYGVQSLCQIIARSAQYGGHELYLPAGTVEDEPRFSYRGLMLDSSRHYQDKTVILKLLDEMSRYKLNRFHWHPADRQAWRLLLDCAPELADSPPLERSYSHGVYTRKDVEEIRFYAAERFIQIIPEIEMPGHSAMVFRHHPELACPVVDDPFKADVWEFCIGNPETKLFLTRILEEICSWFPESPVIHIGGDEAGTTRWSVCPVCCKAMEQRRVTDARALERTFMKEMESVVHKLGRRAMTWGTNAQNYDFSKQMIVQDWLGRDTITAIRSGRDVIGSFHKNLYFDYGNNEAAAHWQKQIYDYDPVPGEATSEEAQHVLGGEGCIWTEQLPQHRVLPRALPRLRALAERLWTDPEGLDFDDFLRREHHLIESGLYRYS